MPEQSLSIAEMKSALIAVQHFCRNRRDLQHSCDDCPFCGRYCLIDNAPEFWGTNAWEPRGCSSPSAQMPRILPNIPNDQEANL